MIGLGGGSSGVGGRKLLHSKGGSGIRGSSGVGWGKLWGQEEEASGWEGEALRLSCRVGRKKFL